MFSKHDQLRGYDGELLAAIDVEDRWQEDHVELVASGNCASRQVIQTQSSGLTNKYAEGHLSKRYYGGCERVDKVERLTTSRARQLSGADYVNVQPHSGSSTDAAMCLTLLNVGGTIPGMSPAHNGHLTRDTKVSPSGKLYNAVQYGLDTVTELIDYDEVERLAVEHKPKMIVISFSAYSKTFDFSRFYTIAGKVGTLLFIDMAHIAGLVAASLYPDPTPLADVAITTTHKVLRDPRGGLILARINEEIEKKLNSAVFLGAQGGPLMRVIAAKTVCFEETLEPGSRGYQAQVIYDVKVMTEVFIRRSYDVVSGGIGNYLMLTSLVEQGLTGKAADAVLRATCTTVSKNAVPNDPQSSFVISGIRIGTPAMTIHSFREGECYELAGWICDVPDDIGNPGVGERVRGQIGEFCRHSPVYAD